MAILELLSRSIKDGREIYIRSAQAADAAAMIDFIREASQWSPYILTRPEEFKKSVEEQGKMVQDFAESDNSIFLLAEFQGNIIGVLSFSGGKQKRIRHRGEFGINIARDFRGLGVGRVLIEELIRWGRSRENPIEKILLGVIDENLPAHRLYQSLGFIEEGRVARSILLDDGRFADEIRMALSTK